LCVSVCVLARYMDEFDNMAQMYIQQMTERHAHNLLEFQRQLQRVRAILLIALSTCISASTLSLWKTILTRDTPLIPLLVIP
jgi:hypothetical protein